jgi:hypothetical protein
LKPPEKHLIVCNSNVIAKYPQQQHQICCSDSNKTHKKGNKLYFCHCNQSNLSEMASANENPSQNKDQHTLDCSEPAGDTGSAFGSSQALSSISAVPPIRSIIQAVPNDPSPLTTSATTADSGAFQ